MTPATPYLHVDPARLRANIRATAERAAAAGVALRPHIKTHKSTEVDDSARRLRDLMDTATVAIGVDSVAGIGTAGRLLGDAPARVLVEVDSGHHRSGALPRDAGALADTARRAGLDVRGVFTFPGHSYAPDLLEQAAADEAAALSQAAASLRAVGIEPEVISGGSTPSRAATDTGVLTELRPGVYVYGDAQQWELGSMAPETIALSCRSTVVSHAGGRLVLDAGSKALGADRAAHRQPGRRGPQPRLQRGQPRRRRPRRRERRAAGLARGGQGSQLVTYDRAHAEAIRRPRHRPRLRHARRVQR